MKQVIVISIFVRRRWLSWAIGISLTVNETNPRTQHTESFRLRCDRLDPDMAAGTYNRHPRNFARTHCDCCRPICWHPIYSARPIFWMCHNRNGNCVSYTIRWDRDRHGIGSCRPNKCQLVCWGRPVTRVRMLDMHKLPDALHNPEVNEAFENNVVNIFIGFIWLAIDSPPRKYSNSHRSHPKRQLPPRILKKFPWIYNFSINWYSTKFGLTEKHSPYLVDLSLLLN